MDLSKLLNLLTRTISFLYAVHRTKVIGIVSQTKHQFTFSKMIESALNRKYSRGLSVNVLRSSRQLQKHCEIMSCEHQPILKPVYPARVVLGHRTLLEFCGRLPPPNEAFLSRNGIIFEVSFVTLLKL